MASVNLLNRITVNNQVVLGKPTVRGTRLTVEHVLKALSAGISFEQLKEDFPFLEEDDLRACIAYASSIMEDEKTYKLSA